jgi:hypothetical protein
MKQDSLNNPYMPTIDLRKMILDKKGSEMETEGRD